MNDAEICRSAFLFLYTGEMVDMFGALLVYWLVAYLFVSCLLVFLLVAF